MLLKQYLKKKLSTPFVWFISFLLAVHFIFLLKVISHDVSYVSPAFQFSEHIKSFIAQPPNVKDNVGLPATSHKYISRLIKTAPEECKNAPPISPIIAPAPVLDFKNMNYSLKPFTPFRPSYYYEPQSPILAPLVTVLTPFYNTPSHLLEDAAKCVFGQTLQLFQWLIVNDGSTKQEALDGLEKYRNIDPRVQIIDLPKNKGLPGARNEGVAQAKGKYLLLFDPDDLIESTYLEKAVWFLETHPDFTLCGAWSVGFGYNHYVWMNGFQSGDRNLRENTITVATVMKTDALRAVGSFDEKLTTGMLAFILFLESFRDLFALKPQKISPFFAFLGSDVH